VGKKGLREKMLPKTASLAVSFLMAENDRKRRSLLLRILTNTS
jgi:hypothetical protein